MDEITKDLVIENLTNIRHGLLEVVNNNEKVIKEIRELLKELQATLETPSLDAIRQEKAGLGEHYQEEVENQERKHGEERMDEEYSKEFVDDIKSQDVHSD